MRLGTGQLCISLLVHLGLLANSSVPQPLVYRLPTTGMLWMENRPPDNALCWSVQCTHPHPSSPQLAQLPKWEAARDAEDGVRRRLQDFR